MSGSKLQRLGLVMEPEPGNPQEIEAVLNPAAARGPDGELYLFPRLTARGNSKLLAGILSHNVSLLFNYERQKGDRNSARCTNETTIGSIDCGNVDLHFSSP